MHVFDLSADARRLALDVGATGAGGLRPEDDRRMTADDTIGPSRPDAVAQILRILDGLTPLRADSDPEDLAACRMVVRSSVERLVDALHAAGDAPAQTVDSTFRGLTGQESPSARLSADTVAGQLGVLRDRFGLVDANVNTVEEEGVRTSFWTLVDLIADLQTSWTDRRDRRPPP
jgi:hypothetical protein